jgi:hypothetical protein
MNLGTQTDAASPPKESRRPSLTSQLNRLPNDIGRVWGFRHIGRVRRCGHTCSSRRLFVEVVASASDADTSTCEGGPCST